MICKRRLKPDLKSLSSAKGNRIPVQTVTSWTNFALSIIDGLTGGRMLRKSDSDCLRRLVEFEIEKNRTPSTSPWDSLFLAFPSDLVLNISRAHADAMKLPNKTNSFTRLNTSEKFRLAVVSSDFTNHSTAHVATELLLAFAEYVDADVHLICTASKERLKHSESCPYRNDLI